MALSIKPSVSRVACILKLVIGAGIGSVGSSFPLMVFTADTNPNPLRSIASPPINPPALTANVGAFQDMQQSEGLLSLARLGLLGTAK